LSELSLLVKAAKRLQDSQRMTLHEEEVNDVVDEMIMKAFKIVTKGVRFMDILEEDRRSRVPAIALMPTVTEESCVPPTPPADCTSFDANQNDVNDAGLRMVENGNAAERAMSATSEATQNLHTTAKRLSSVYSPNVGAHRLSQGAPLQVNRLSSSISHRVSLGGPSPLSQPRNLVSDRLNLRHDHFLSHLGSFIGRLQLQSQSCPHLALAVKQSATSGGELLMVIDVVCAHNSIMVEGLNQSRALMHGRIQHLVRTAHDVLIHTGPEMGDLIIPQDNSRLLGAATGCVKATGDCVAKAKYVLERIGDFEFDFDSSSMGVDLDLSALDFIPSLRDRSHSIGSANGSVAESGVSEAPTVSTAVSSSSAAARTINSSMDKPLPEVPQFESPIDQNFPSHYSPASSRPHSILVDDNAANLGLVSSVSSLRSALPPLPRISTTLLPDQSHSPTERSSTHDGEFHSFRSDSMTASSSSSANTYISRDSELSMLSQTSTRATTPDNTAAPRNQPSLSSLSVAGSSTLTEDVDEVESKLLAKTFAHELMFNAEGQVTGGSLAALVERLTTHESTPDATFVSTFYLTFRLFCTPIQFAEALIDRFDYVADAPHVAAPVRLRTHNVFKSWLESHWRDETDRVALPLIRDFANCKLTPILQSAGLRLLELTEKVASSDGALVPRSISSMGKASNSASHYNPVDVAIPQPVATKSQLNLLANWKAGNANPSIMDFDPLEVARQLTIKQMVCFCSIKPHELLSGSAWNKNGGITTPNIKQMIALTNNLSILVSGTILRYEEVKKRAAAIKHWIKVAEQCLSLHNYDALAAIMSALDATSIRRLRITWDSVSARRKETVKTLTAIVNHDQNYKVLRQRLHSEVPPCLPYVGMFLTDLTFADTGNPDTKTSDTGLTVINFDKYTKYAKFVGELQRFQIPHRLAEQPDMQEWLSEQLEQAGEQDKAGANVQASQYRKSLLLEPREAHNMRTPVEGTTTTTGLGTGMFGWMRSNSTSHNMAGQP